MSQARPIAVTGAGGRLGSALVSLLRTQDRQVVGWSRPSYDLDDPLAASRSVAAELPGLVIHAAAWTDVDGCARDPELAHRRNGQAVAELAEACRDAGASLMLVSTNEVFDGDRNDGRGYQENDPTRPLNAYGRSKLAGEAAARAVLPRAWIVRTAWLFGPPGADFPARILAAADRLPAGQALRVVADEIGSPTYAPDLAAAIVALVDTAAPDTYHLVNEGRASRHDWALAVLRGAGRSTPLEPIGLADYTRASTPPAWGVLDPAKAAAAGVTLRHWQAALDEYVAALGAPRT